VAARDFLGALAAASATTGRRRAGAVRLALRSGGLIAAVAMSWAERFDEASTWASGAVDLARGRQHPGERALALLVRADIDYRRGRLAASHRDARQALQLSKQVSAAGLYAAAAALAARVLLDRGELDAALALLDRVETPVALHPLLRGIVLDVRGLAALVAGRPDDAIAQFLECGHQLAARGIAGPACVPWRTHAVLAYQAIGETPAARTIAAADVDLARTWGAPGVLGIALAAASACESADERRAQVAEAVALLDDAGRPLDLARALGRQAGAIRDAGDPAAAREASRRAADLARDCGAIALVQQLQADAVPGRGGAPRPVPTSRPIPTPRASMAGGSLSQDSRSLLPDDASLLPDDASYPAPASAGVVPGTAPRPRLTAGERRVIDLVRQGMSNHAVAEELCLSKRTVDTHLGRVYRKLGIRGRIELAAALDALAE